MTIQPIGSASVALYITPADLKEHGLTPEVLTLAGPGADPYRLPAGGYGSGGLH